MPNFDVEFFEKSDGTFPAEEFILSQDVKMQAKLFRLLELLEVNGNNLREPYSKSLDDGIFEIRAKQGIILREFCIFSLSAARLFSRMALPKRLKKHHPEKLNCPRSIVPNMNSERRIYNGQKL